MLSILISSYVIVLLAKGVIYMTEDRKTKNYKFSSETKTLPLLPLRDIFVFPTNIVPIFIGREKSIVALEEAMKEKKHIMLAAQKDPSTVNPTFSEIFQVGTVAKILQLLKLPDGTVKILAEGQKRGFIEKISDKKGFLSVDFKEIQFPLFIRIPKTLFLSTQ